MLASGLSLSAPTYDPLSDPNFAGGGTHYVATFDLSKLDLSKGALFHNTMECGNDNILGQSGPIPTPEPGTMMLLGFGMLGLAVYGKRRMNKEA